MSEHESDNAIYANYFDEAGSGPTVLELAPDDFATLNAEIGHPIFGFGFKMADDFNLNNAPIGGGVSMYRDAVVRMHAAMAAWLVANPEVK